MIGSVCLSFVAVFCLPKLFGIAQRLSMTEVLFDVSVVLASYFVVSIMMRIMRTAKLLQ